MARALRLSETQRARAGTLPIHEPSVFFESPRGVCVDVARFAVESLLAIDPQTKASYLMIEFDLATLSGQTLRRHWVATFERATASSMCSAIPSAPGFWPGPMSTPRPSSPTTPATGAREVVALSPAAELRAAAPPTGNPAAARDAAQP